MKTQKTEVKNEGWKIQKIGVKLEGIKPIILNGFTSIDEKDISADKKIIIKDGKVIIDSDRIMSFLTSNNPKKPIGCIKLFTDQRKYKILIAKAEAYIGIEPWIIPISEDDKYVVRTDQVCGGSVPIKAKRPMVEKWGAEFQINLIENQNISFELLKSWFIKGGVEVGLGAWRPRYGQFRVVKFEKIS